jgi:L,D-transpeptidase YbiS
MDVQTRIEISLEQQCLWLIKNEKFTAMPVSTALNGAGQKLNSECTPLGEHWVRAKIGEGCPMNTVFVGRRPEPELYSPERAISEPNRDWILTRILWLSGLEVGSNRLGDVDTMRRYIYIHGTPDSVPMGVPGSHGCIRMRNCDVIFLFDQIDVGTRVSIYPGSRTQ